MRKSFFTKTNIQLLVMSFLGIILIVAMSLYVGASVHDKARDTASIKTSNS